MKAVDYYKRKYGNDKAKAIIHLVSELGEFTGSYEKGKDDGAKYELAEVLGLCHYLADQYGFDISAKAEEIYKDKLKEKYGVE